VLALSDCHVPEAGGGIAGPIIDFRRNGRLTELGVAENDPRRIRSQP
jgi:hypothetical protein